MGSMVRLESSVAPRILTLSESWMSVPARLQDFRPEKHLSLLGVPNRMATDFVGLRPCHFHKTKCEESSNTTQLQKCLGYQCPTEIVDHRPTNISDKLPS